MTFSVDDPLTWRVTLENPIREVDGTDWERCASLHNLITQLGWTGLGNTETEMPRSTWWQVNITNESLEEEWSRRLSPSLKLFLQAAYETPHGNFFYYVSGLNGPSRLYTGLHEQGGGILSLYQMTNLNLSGHRDGLKYSKKNSNLQTRTDLHLALTKRHRGQYFAVISWIHLPQPMVVWNGTLSKSS